MEECESYLAYIFFNVSCQQMFTDTMVPDIWDLEHVIKRYLVNAQVFFNKNVELSRCLSS